MADMECELCGGTDFCKEAGYFFCNECQTQSQEVREHEFQEEATEMRNISGKKIKQPLPDKSKNKITSWECYNIVIYSLTKQLINLGADKKLKSVVKCLWMKYLEKLEVLHLKVDEVPKLQLVNSKKDSIILYGEGTKIKKRKSSVSEGSSTSLLPISKLKKERSKKKRALAQAEYNIFSQESTQESSSLHNDTLTSLKSDSEKTVKTECRIKFTRYSVKELRKKVSKQHCEKHKLDKGQKLKCHKLTYRSNPGYAKDVRVLSPLRIYCILYLALLIIRDKIQLGDLFRFIREGHLSFNNYTQLFPDAYSEKLLNIQNNTKNCMFTNKSFRTTAASIAVFLDVFRYIEVVDLTQLCQRFCRELNLSDAIFKAVKNIISRTKPKLTYTKQAKMIPNYEGRAVSIILFTLKLLFGFDGATEFELSKYAQCVNSLNTDEQKMFDIIKWIEYIGYRNLIVCEYHFPYSYKEDSEEINSDLFLQYIKSRNVQLDENIKLTKELTDYKDVLMQIKDLQHHEDKHIEFPSSLTPFLDYSKIIHSATLCHSEQVLLASFEDDSLNFLLKPYKYLKLFGENVALKHGGANDNWIIEDVKSYRHVRSISALNHRLIPIEILKSGPARNVDKMLHQEPKRKKTHDPLYVQTHYQQCRQHIFDKNDVILKNISGAADSKEDIAGTKMPQSYNVHFNPYERYWLYLQMNIDHISKTECEQYFDKYPHTFKLIFKECTRIVEQSEQELLDEFLHSELYLVYAATYCNKSKKTVKTKFKKLLPGNIGYYVSQAEAYW